MSRKGKWDHPAPRVLASLFPREQTSWASAPNPPSPTTGTWALCSRRATVRPACKRGQRLCRHWGLRLLDLRVPHHQHPGQLGVWEPGRQDGQGLVGVGGIQGEKETMQDLVTAWPPTWRRWGLEGGWPETGEQNPGTPGEEGTPGQRLGTLPWRSSRTIDFCKFCGQRPHRSADWQCLSCCWWLQSHVWDGTGHAPVCGEWHTRVRKVIRWPQCHPAAAGDWIEALKEELLFMKKNHEEEVKGLQNQIANWADRGVGCPQTSRTLARSWQTSGPSMTSWLRRTERSWTSTGPSRLGEHHDGHLAGSWDRSCWDDPHRAGRTVQSLEIDLDSMRNLKASLENSLREVEHRYTMQMEQLNGVLLYLESELAQTRAEGQHQTQDTRPCWMSRSSWEAEINTCAVCWKMGRGFQSWRRSGQQHLQAYHPEDHHPQARGWAKWCLRPQTPKFWGTEAAEAGSPGGTGGQ